MIIAVIGVGVIGSAVVSALSKNEEISQIHVLDTDQESLDLLQEEIGNKLVRTHNVDARNLAALKPILSEANCIISCVRPQLNVALSELALKIGVSFCDLGGNKSLVFDQLKLNEEAQKKGIWILPNCGLAPGLVNILYVHGLSEFDHVELAELRAGNIPLTPKPPFNFASFFSAEKLIEDYTDSAVAVKDGEVIEVDALTGLEEISFDEYGDLEAFHTSGVLAHMRPSLVTKCDNVNFKTIHYPHHANQMRFLTALGFADKRLIDIGTHLTYRDILARKIKRHLWNDEPDVVLVRVSLTGTYQGKPKKVVYELIETYDEKTKSTALKRVAGYSVATVAYLLAAGKVKGSGVTTPALAIPNAEFLERMEKAGFNITKKVS
jgi:lysine 6-dehydrogenase